METCTALAGQEGAAEDPGEGEGAAVAWSHCTTHPPGTSPGVNHLRETTTHTRCNLASALLSMSFAHLALASAQDACVPPGPYTTYEQTDPAHRESS